MKKKVYWIIAALVLAVIYIDSLKTLPKGIACALGVALGYMIGAILWSIIKDRKKK